ncbi:VOC family protein [Gluconobacter sp. Dm-62]|uniref:2-oxoadipate dioxygenase/decarboxylase HglS n=1 Tax=Gluconobacter sp. Dm-62 TaxID=2799804 RepID=UPI001B8D3F6E|nr:VOC family protein [Gluconobacter sp. Dm-62]MBS1103568.1 VOC family protein [Gluconobacter sp. Dm-62]
MTSGGWASADEIRTRFACAMSDMYRQEVPQYDTLLELVAQVNADVLRENPQLRDGLEAEDALGRLNVERHGAVRVGRADELAVCARLFAVMGMVPVGYYDLSVAGVPVHSTAFRPVDEAALHCNPFRIFTSLLRLELIADAELRAEAEEVLSRRNIFTPGVMELIVRHEAQGGLSSADADLFVTEALETFRWHSDATVSADIYQRLSHAHRLIADVVCFRGPHINHLTPRTLDIDAVQRRMPEVGIKAKAVVEGPPTRDCPILLRQTSFTALEEKILFQSPDGQAVTGTHTARFGEIEQRGVALTAKGRALYDRLLGEARSGSEGSYEERLQTAFASFPDDEGTLRTQGLAFFRYVLVDPDAAFQPECDLEVHIASGAIKAFPITYEDFLPVSAAGIFQSNLGGQILPSYAENASRDAFETALGRPVLDEMALYAGLETASIIALRKALMRPESSVKG